MDAKLRYCCCSGQKFLRNGAQFTVPDGIKIRVYSSYVDPAWEPLIALRLPMKERSLKKKL